MRGPPLFDRSCTTVGLLGAFLATRRDGRYDGVEAAHTAAMKEVTHDYQALYISIGAARQMDVSTLLHTQAEDFFSFFW